MKLFIGCSSSDEIDKIYFEESKNLLDILFKDNDLVFGADDTGLMGLSYQIAKKNHRKIIGVCPKIYKDDFKKMDCDVEVVADGVGDRTSKAIENSDALIFLPGGVGTVYEFFTTLESKRCHEHDKPIIIYNCCGYFDKMISMLNSMYDDGFTRDYVKNLYYVCDCIEDVLKCLNF